ncbi:hypothetical protein [Aestuariivirga sp.]|uniref:hypothetical protein n=1 Tax=Aestuariivirga sp. TaxID=2650926 RepID=UPI0039E22FD5
MRRRGENRFRFDHGGRTFAIYRSPHDSFHATDGLAMGAPACVNLRSYPVKVEAGQVMIEI